MESVFSLLRTYGYWVIFLAVLLDFLGAPITTMPLLIVAGALAAAGKMSLASITLLAAAAAVLADTIWYSVGRTRGASVLGGICRLTRNRQQCVHRSTQFLGKYSTASLLFSKFVPGVSTITPPAAGAAGMRWLKFLLLDASGSLVWAAASAGGGYVLSVRVTRLLDAMSRSRSWTLLIFIAFVTVLLSLFARKSYPSLRRRSLESGIEVR